MANTRSEVSLHQNKLQMNTMPRGAIFNDQKVYAAVEATLSATAARSSTGVKPSSGQLSYLIKNPTMHDISNSRLVEASKVLGTGVSAKPAPGVRA